MRSSRHPSPARPLVAALAAVALLAACGGDGEEPAGPTHLGVESPRSEPAQVDADTATSEPAETEDAATTTAAPDQATVTDAPTGTPPPPAADPGDQEEYDDDPRVEIVREWAEEYAVAATERDPDREDWLDTMTGEAVADRMLLIEDDLGWTYPGPVPLTVTQVVDREEGTAAVEACVLARGFAQDPDTRAVPEDELVYPMEFHLRATDDDADDFVITGIYLGNQSCSGIKIERNAW